MRVTLTLDEQKLAEETGVAREALRRRRGKAVATPKDRGGSWNERNAQGALAEYALAKHLNVLQKWLTEQAYSEEHWLITSDVGKNIQVRSTKYASGGLTAYDTDPDEAVFVLAVVVEPSIDFIGWTYGRLAKRPIYWEDRRPGFRLRPCYLVPQLNLFPMETLPEEVV